MFDIRRCGGDRAACLVVRDLKHAMARIDRELLASAGPGVDRALVGSWRHRSVKRVIRCGSERKGVRERARTDHGFEVATVGRRWKDAHECPRYTARSVAIESKATLEVVCGGNAIVAICNRGISFAIVCKSRWGYQAHLTATA